MTAVLAFIVIAVVAVIVLSFVLHLLFSPWLLLAVALVLAVKFWPRRSRSNQ